MRNRKYINIREVKEGENDFYHRSRIGWGSEQQWNDPMLAG